MKRILWLSQHAPLPVQLERLRAKFGQDADIIHDPKTFTSAEVLWHRFWVGRYDDWVVVAPMSVIGRVCELAREHDRPRPLYAEMQVLHRSQRGQEDFSFHGRLYKFLKFRRVKRLVFEFEEGEDF